MNERRWTSSTGFPRWGDTGETVYSPIREYNNLATRCDELSNMLAGMGASIEVRDEVEIANQKETPAI